MSDVSSTTIEVLKIREGVRTKESHKYPFLALQGKKKNQEENKKEKTKILECN